MALGGLMAQRCPRCGTSNRDESRFCLYCGATLPGLTTEDAPRPAVTAPISTPLSAIRVIPPPAPRGRAPDFVGLLGVAFFLLVLGVVFYLNQNLLTDLRQWWDQIVTGRLLFRPPEGVISSAIGFWALIGVTNFVVAALRWSLRRTKIHTLGAALGGIGAITFAYLLYRYSLRQLSGSQLVSFEAAVIAILLFVYIGLGLRWTSTRRRLAYEAARRSPR